MLDRLRLFGLVALVILAVVLILQNIGPAEASILFISLKMPLAVMLMLTFAIGFVVGLLTAGRLTRKKREKEKADALEE